MDERILKALFFLDECLCGMKQGTDDVNECICQVSKESEG